MSAVPAESAVISLSLAVSFDPAINYAFHQNAIPMVKELRFQNDGVALKDIVPCHHRAGVCDSCRDSAEEYRGEEEPTNVRNLQVVQIYFRTKTKP